MIFLENLIEEVLCFPLSYKEKNKSGQTSGWVDTIYYTCPISLHKILTTEDDVTKLNVRNKLLQDFVILSEEKTFQKENPQDMTHKLKPNSVKRGKMKKYFFSLVYIFLSILICASFCFPQKPEQILITDTLGVEPESGNKGYRFASNTGFIQVPFELICNHIYLKVKVNNSQYLSFLLDTGARSSYLDSSKADELNIKNLDMEEARRITGYGDISLFKFDSIGIGNLTVFDQNLFGISLGHLNKFEGTNLDGILGYDFLRRFAVEVDYTNQILTIYEPDKFSYTGDGEVLKINLELNIPKTKAIVDGEHDGILEIDTGSRNGLDLYAPFVKKHKFLEKYPKHLEISLGFGITGPIEGSVGRIESFQLGSFLMKSPVTGFYLKEESPFGSSKIAGKIGGGILKRFKVIFDYPHYRMILEKNADYDLWDRYNTSGIQLIQDTQKILVYQVIKKSPAEKAKIQKEDEILFVNGISVSNYSLQEIREILTQEEGTKIELTLKRKTKTKKVKLMLKELI